MAKSWQDKESDFLIKALLSIQSEEELYAFLEDVCTISEIKSMAQRLAVARLLKKDVPYTKICEETGASSATISRVNRALQYGASGYEAVLGHMEDGKEDA